ncbi:MAG TPA: hypothetical protein VL993_15030 [Stellaceae bacterium]|nr:hypothetical protein [Stellaceae bacterium]
MKPARQIEIERQEKEDDARFTTSLAGLAVALLLGIASLYLLDALAAESNLEDCLLQGRMDCEPIDASTLAE